MFRVQTCRSEIFLHLVGYKIIITIFKPRMINPHKFSTMNQHLVFLISLLMVQMGCTNTELSENVEEYNTMDSLMLVQYENEEVLEEQPEIVIEYLEDLAVFNSHDDLASFFGKENVAQTEYWRAEGTVKFPVTILYPNTKHPVHFFWTEESDRFEGLSFIELHAYIHDDESGYSYADYDYWKLRNGLKLNLSIDKLEKMNGEEFKFFGFEWDFGGSTYLKHSKFTNYHVTLGFMHDPDKDYPPEYMELLGDQEISSKNPTARELGVSVTGITFTPN